MEQKIDIKDKKILFELDFDARQSFSELGKKVGLSKQVVEYRVNNLIKKGIINGFYPVINIPKLGYHYCRLSITLQNISPEEQEKIILDLESDHRVFWLLEVQGSFDLLIVIWAPTLKFFRDFVDEFMVKYSSYVKHKMENIGLDVIHYQHRYLLQKKETSEIHIKETSERFVIDELDHKILIWLCENARIPLIKIAEKLKENPRTIAYRIARMEKGLIESYKTVIDHNKLGYTYLKVFVNLSNHNKDIKKIKECIKNNPATIYLVEGINLHGDIDFEIMIKNNNELLNLIRDLRKNFPAMIADYNTVAYLRTLKIRYLPF